MGKAPVEVRGNGAPIETGAGGTPKGILTEAVGSTGSGFGASIAVESDQGVSDERTGAEARGFGIGVERRGSGAELRGRGAGPEGAAGNSVPTLTQGARLGPDGSGGTLARVGSAAPFFQVSATEQPAQRSCASAGPATTSAGSGSLHNGHEGVATKTSELIRRGAGTLDSVRLRKDYRVPQACASFGGARLRPSSWVRAIRSTAGRPREAPHLPGLRPSGR